jgi:hypothetical protein
MTITRIAASAALAGAIALAAILPASAAGASSPQTVPETAAADAAASWLAGRLAPDGSIPSTVSPGSPDLTATANTVLALASSTGTHTQAMAALTFLESHVDAYVPVAGSDGPGQLALLILDAHALGVSPTSFGGTNLVTRLLATQQATGTQAGLFGVQDATFDGAYRQGLALSALAVAGVRSGAGVTAAETWLTGQQCKDGGWTSLVTASNPCNGKPQDYQGPDTNSTAVAVEGLEAQGALAPAAAKSALSFLKRAEDADGGWGYEPNSAYAPGSTDPDSTALVVQALLALGAAPTSATFTKSGTNPEGSIMADQITSGTDAGGISFPGIPGADLLATYQAVPALAGVTLAYDVSTPTVSHVGPAKGTVAGGTVVTLKGTGLSEAGTVLFGTTLATGVTVVSGTKITVVAPPHAAGAVAVTVTSPFGTSVVGTADHFTYR